MRRRISYANVAATLALVFSMSGGALAANHYLISSTKQISPKVLKKLKVKGATGKTGAIGPAGPAGASGKEGSQGKEGASGTYPTTLTSGHSESGNYAVAAGDSKTGFMTEGISFPVPLAGTLDESHASWLQEGTTSSSCPGPGQAAAGHLCVYEESGAHDAPNEGHAVNNSEGMVGSDSTGFMLFFNVTGEEAFSYGSWTVTAA